MIYVTKNNYVIYDNKNKMAQGSGQRFKAEAEAKKLHVYPWDKNASLG